MGWKLERRVGKRRRERRQINREEEKWDGVLGGRCRVR